MIYQYGHGGTNRRTPTDATPRSLDGLSVLVPEHVVTESLGRQAYYLLRDRIVTLQLPPGTLVNERDLMAESGFGRTPIREALQRLADDGLVEVYPRRGIYVGPIDVGDLGAISEIRVELEGFVARLAAERASDEDRTNLRALVPEVVALAREPDQHRLIHLDQRIHRLIYRAARNPFLEAALDRYYVLALRLWFLALDRIRHLDEAVHDHVEQLEAIAGGDAVAAETIARQHVIEFERQIRELL
jgi:DNA-binding GntR family transcriptional regulator